MLLTMTDDELLRIKLIQDICDKRITGVEAARILSLSSRQIYRLVKRFITLGSSGLLSLKRGRPSNHRHDDKVKLQTLAIVHEYYADFGPTLAHEKLADVDQGQVVDNKRLGAVLKFAQEKQQEFDQQQKRSRSKSAPKRTAQQRAVQQLRGINPALASPETFKPSTKKG
ncbi:helix-turn-helix domain-containing protein [Photobacterium indicum]|uniref:ISNCY family transposase n=1 Tax=Photobacterium indicum TaxID=81447 RepID=A0A2T3L3Y4_9GAMM|nr:helix-turn-helix domain-containing protein [Photobacterium indicum]PSV44055.1 hypothetical protein C9J47_20550 [Photobacterium indicum]